VLVLGNQKREHCSRLSDSALDSSAHSVPHWFTVELIGYIRHEPGIEWLQQITDLPWISDAGIEPETIIVWLKDDLHPVVDVFEQRVRWSLLPLHNRDQSFESGSNVGISRYHMRWFRHVRSPLQPSLQLYRIGDNISAFTFYRHPFFRSALGRSRRHSQILGNKKRRIEAGLRPEVGTLGYSVIQVIDLSSELNHKSLSEAVIPLISTAWASC
jgi:hypothetical protein